MKKYCEIKHLLPVAARDERSFRLGNRQGVSGIALLIFAAVFTIASFSFVSLRFSDKNSPGSGENLFSKTSAMVLKTMGGLFSNGEKKPVLEIDIGENSGADGNSSAKTSVAKVFSQKIPEQYPKNSAPVENGKNDGAQNFSASSSQIENKVSVLPEPEVRKKISNCSFSKTGVYNHQIIFSELNWAGSKDSANDEWMELKNNSGSAVELGGWRILSADENIKITLEEKTLPAGGFYLLERTDDDSAPGAAADAIYSGALSNSGAVLKILDPNCELSDEIDASKKWPAGDSSSRKTMERSNLDLSWQTSELAGGTPKKENSMAFARKEPEISFASPTDNEINQPADSPADDQAATSTPQDSQAQNQTKPVITEIMAGMEGNSGYEFVELYNPGPEEIDLTGWTIKKRSSTGSESTLVASNRLEGKKIPPNKHFLAASEAVSSIISDADVYWPKSYTLAYTNNAVAVYDPGSAKAGEIGWTDIPAGSSYERQPVNGDQFMTESNPNPQNSTR